MLILLYSILRDNVELRYGYTKIFSNKEQYPSFKAFFAEKEFADISRFIGKPKNQYRVVSVGLYPSVAQYNGFYTLDSYQNNYPLEYKREFRKIILGELDKNEKLKEYFDDWGNRCYVFSDELYKKGFIGKKILENYKDPNIKIINLKIDVIQLKKMGGEYIFSAVPIDNAEELHLEYQKTFTDKDALWDIYLYKI